MEGTSAVIDPTANPAAENVKLDENGNPITEDALPPNINEEIMQDMKNIFAVFDTDSKNEVSISELSTIMRALDVDIKKEGALEAILKEIDPDQKGVFTFE